MRRKGVLRLLLLLLLLLLLPRLLLLLCGCAAKDPLKELHLVVEAPALGAAAARGQRKNNKTE
jgi:hypothetical protein